MIKTLPIVPGCLALITRRDFMQTVRCVRLLAPKEEYINHEGEERWNAADTPRWLVAGLPLVKARTSEGDVREVPFCQVCPTILLRIDGGDTAVFEAELKEMAK